MNYKKLQLFVGLVCLQSWFVAAIIYATDISYNSGTAVALVGLFYMSAPAVATFALQRTLFPESYSNYGLSYTSVKIGKLFFYSLLAFLSFVVLYLGLTYLGGNLLGIPEVGVLDFSEEGLIKSLKRITKGSIDFGEDPLPFPPYMLLIGGLIGGVFSGFTINLPFMFGEEYGWRGFMVYETRNLGFFKSNLLIGTIWGLWHAPIILLGHNYPSYPIAGVGIMTLFCIAGAFMFAYVRVKSGSVIAACGLHGMFNATGALLMLFNQNGHELVAHPAGLIGTLACAIFALCIIIFDTAFVKNYTQVLQLVNPESNADIKDLGNYPEQD